MGNFVKYTLLHNTIVQILEQRTKEVVKLIAALFLLLFDLGLIP